MKVPITFLSPKMFHYFKGLIYDGCVLTFSFSTKSTNVVLSISTGWPWRSYKASTKWKKLDLRRLEGGCFSKCARARPTPLRTQAQERQRLTPRRKGGKKKSKSMNATVSQEKPYHEQERVHNPF